MAFEIRNYDKLSLSVAGAAPIVGTYGSTTDNLTTILTSGYFDQLTPVLRIGDLIITQAIDIVTQLQITGISPVTTAEMFKGAIEPTANFGRWKMSAQFGVPNDTPIGVSSRFPFDTLIEGALSDFDLVNNVLVVSRKGLYTLNWQARALNDNGVGTIRCPVIVTNGVHTNGKSSAELQHPVGVSHGYGISFSTILDVNDVVEFGIRQNSGITLNFADNITFLNIALIYLVA